MAMGCGLNMAIANPLFSEIMDEIAAGALLYNRPLAMKKFLETYANVPPTAAAPGSSAKTLSPSGAIRQDVLLGNRESICKNIASDGHNRRVGTTSHRPAKPLV
jgi:hypothetical protein